MQRKQCDQIRRNFANWAIFFGVWRFFSEKQIPMIWTQFFLQNNRQNYTSISSRFWLLLAIKMPNFDKLFRWVKSLFGKAPYLVRLHFRRFIGQNWKLFSTERLVTLIAGLTRALLCLN
jgi:hypothetical protein